MHSIVTERLVLRPWEPTDLDYARAWHGDPLVMRHLGGILDHAGSDATVQRWTAELKARSYGMLALCPVGSGPPVGAVGLGHPGFRSHFTPCVEIGWRLARKTWGRGYATEAARAVLRVAFDRLGLTEIVAFTAMQNSASCAVMARLGMRPDPNGNFIRRFSPNGPASPSVLWRISTDHTRENRGR